MQTAGADESTRPGEHENARFVPAWTGVKGSGDATSMLSVVLNRENQEETMTVFQLETRTSLKRKRRVASPKVSVFFVAHATLLGL